MRWLLLSRALTVSFYPLVCSSASWLPFARFPLSPSLTQTRRTNKNSSMSTNDGDGDKKSEGVLPRIDGVEEVATTRWLALNTLKWTDKDGKARSWDVATRTTKQRADGDVADGVAIIPLLRHADGRRVDTLLVEQYRPPVGRATVEFPAGLIDAGETPAQAALRELREETGYVGEACKIQPAASRPLCMSPGLTDESVHVVVVEVDLSNPYNVDPKPDLDDGEHCVVRRVELREGIQKLLDDGSTPMPIMGLYLFALGYELGAKQQSSSSSSPSPSPAAKPSMDSAKK